MKKLPKLKFNLLLISILLACEAFSQVDSTYIGFFEQKHSLRPYFSYSFTSLTHEVNDNKVITYRPNTPFGIGLDLSYRGISIGGAYKPGFLRDGEKGKTRLLDFQYHFYKRKFVFDFFFQDYKGLYVQEKEGDDIELYPDIHLTQYGIFGQYVFNGNQFSYQAAFSQNEKQLKSVGSFLLGGGIYINRARSDSSLVFTEGRHFLNNFQFGVSAGYAYTWVASNRFYVSGSMTVGVNVGAESVSAFGKKKTEVYPTLFPRISVGYNNEDWSISFTGINNRVFIFHSDESNMAFDTGHIQVSFIKRFNLLPPFARKAERKIFGGKE